MAERNGTKLQDPKVEQLMEKLKMQRRGKSVLEEEIKNLESVNNTQQKELEKLQTEVSRLEGIYKEKEELYRKLQLQREESDRECEREMKQIKARKALLEQYKCETQEVKLKHRKLRMRFGNQVQQLMEEHKQLHSVFAPERLPTEVEKAENTISQLLSAEKQKLVQLHQLDEELQKKKQLEKKASGDGTD